MLLDVEGSGEADYPSSVAVSLRFELIEVEDVPYDDDGFIWHSEKVEGASLFKDE